MKTQYKRFAALALIASHFSFAAVVLAHSQNAVAPPPVYDYGEAATPALAVRAAALEEMFFHHGEPSAHEQLMLELVNRARANPAAEAARLGINLNQGLQAGSISAEPKPPLAFHPALIDAARRHSEWMLATDTFSHSGEAGSSPGDRMTDVGYPFNGQWRWGENIAWRGTSGTPALTAFAALLHEGLFRSPGHRQNLLDDDFDEIGIGLIGGSFFDGTAHWNAVMGTQKFAASAGTPGPLVLGVVYRDHDQDGRYDVDEGVPDVAVELIGDAGGRYTFTSDSGGYALPYQGEAPLQVVFSGGPLPFPIITEATGNQQNVKLDGLLTADDLALDPYVRQVQQMYVAYYGRPGDPDGVEYWAGRLAVANGNWIVDLVNAFGNSAEYRDRFSGLGAEALIDNLYMQLFNRQADAFGRQFYADLLSGGNDSGLNPTGRRSSLAQIALDIANGAINDDSIILVNKLALSLYFTKRVKDTGTSYQAWHIPTTVAIVGTVDAAIASVFGAMGAVDSFVGFGIDRLARASGERAED